MVSKRSSDNVRKPSGRARRAVATLGAISVMLVIGIPAAHADPDLIENGFTYTITGDSAEIRAFNPFVSDVPLADFVIPATLGGKPTERIATRAFDNKGLSGRLSFPDSVTSIGDYAFAGNVGITSVSFGTTQSTSALTSIGEAAFALTGLAGTLLLPNSLTTIGDTAFANLGGVTSVSFGTSQTAAALTTIGDSTFNGMNLTGALLFPNSLINLGPGAFGNNSRLTSVAFGTSQSAASLTSIGQGAFSATGLTGSLLLPDSLVTIGAAAFVSLPYLTSISFESAPGRSHLETIGNVAFYGDSGLSGNLSIPDSVTSIEDAAFQRAGATTLSLGTSISTSQLTSIGISAFDYPGMNTRLEIPDAVTTIGNAAFVSFENLTQLTVGSGMSRINNNVFALAPLTAITFTGNAPTSVGTSAFASSYTTTFTRWQGSTGWGSTYAGADMTFNVVIAAPTVTSVSPASGSITGNQPITITGTGFATGASVTMGTPASSVSVVNSRTITARTPIAAGAGAVAVTVSNVAVDAGEPLSGFLNSAYTYLGPGPLTFSSGVFPTVTVGSAASLIVTVTNSGGGELIPSAITVAGAGVTTTGGTCAVSGYIGGGETCTLNLSWVPTMAGDLSAASLTIAYSNGDAPSQTLNLSGIATTPSQGGSGAAVDIPVANSPVSSPSQPVPTELSPGVGSLLINGVATPVVVEKSADGKDVIITGGGVRLVLSATGVNGQPVPLGPDGSLVVSAAGGIPMVGSGFAAGSTVTLFMFSTPVTLGTATVNAAGAYSTTAVIPGSTTTGSHTIQVVGTSTAGQPIALSLGVTIASESMKANRITLHLKRARAHTAGSRFSVEARGVQVGCSVKFWVKGSTATARAGSNGVARVRLTSPRSTDSWMVTARVGAATCSPAAANTRLRVITN